MSMKLNYRAITGKELKIGISNTITNSIKENPQLKAHLTYHRAIVEWGYRISAYPADVPVPKEVDDLFNASAPEYSDEDFEKLLRNRETLEKFIEHYKPMISVAEKYLKDTTPKEAKDFGVIEVGDKPDIFRQQHDIPILGRAEIGGRIVDAPISSEIKLKVE